MTSSAPRLILRAEHLWDGVTDRSPAYMTMSEGRIEAVEMGSPPPALVAHGVLIDLGTATLLPGLIDCHVHITFAGDGSSVETTEPKSDEELTALALGNAAIALASGITTLRDCGGRGTITLEVRRRLATSDAPAPRLVACGVPLTRPRGHCATFGRLATTAEEMRVAINELADLGVDFIKIIGSGGGTPGTMPWVPSYDTKTLRRAVAEAHRRGLPVSVHSLNAEATRRAIAAGSDHIEHAGFTTDAEGRQSYEPELARALASTGVGVTPTLSTRFHTVKALARAAARSPHQETELARWTRMLLAHVDQVRALIGAGVNIVSGTDAGWRHTPANALFTEIELLGTAGASACMSLEATTTGAARVLGLQDEVGALRPGMCADVIAVAGNALRDPSTLSDPLLVIRGGRIAKGPTRFPAQQLAG